jgi:NADPH:quinone reductase-like Zn-dependent oxidoreductase
MKAAYIERFGAEDVFTLGEQPEPQVKEDQIKIRVAYSSINPIDWKQRKGNHRFILGAPFPIILGYDVCGQVVETGKKVMDFQVGDQVYGVLDNKYGGALAEYAVGNSNCFAHKPVNITDEEAAAVPMVALTVLQALRDKAALKKGQTLIINGASGGVGHVAMQAAKIMNTKVIAVAGTKSENFVKQYNPDQFIDYKKENLLLSGIKCDVFFDVAGVYNFPQCLDLLKPKGVYINTLPRPKIIIHKLFQLISGKKVKTLLMKHRQDDLKLITQWIEQGKMKPYINNVYELSAISEAHRYAQKGHSKGKNVIRINQNI